MQNRTRWLATGWLLAMVGCGPRIGNAGVAPCSGLRAVIVSNNSREAVDISSVDPGDAGHTVLGSVSPGERAEFVLPLGSVGAGMTRIPTIDRRNPTPNMQSAVRFQYVCR